MDWFCPKCGSRFEEHPGRCPGDGSIPAPNLKGRDLLGRYRIGPLLGAGGMGCVFSAVQLAVNRKVAIKFLPLNDPATSARFRREALTVSQLEHHNTVTVFDFGESEDDMPFLVMELLDGRSLSRLVADEGALAPARALHIIDQVLASLIEAHDRGIVHRDLKPDNILLIRRGEDEDFVKVLDFGLAKILHADPASPGAGLTQDGSVFGTPHYMSPEQASARPLDQRSDLYTVGVVLHQMLTGQLLFSADSMPLVMAMQVETPPTPISGCRPDLRYPPGLEELVLSLLEKEPEARPQNAVQTRDRLAPLLSASMDLGRVVDVSQSTATTRQPGQAAPSGNLRWPLMTFGALAGLLLLGGLIGGLVWWSGRPEAVPGPAAVHLPDSGAPDSAVQLQAANVEREKEREKERERTQPQRSISKSLTIAIDSRPQGATVRRGDELLGTTPLRFELPRKDRSLELTLSRPGFRSYLSRLSIDAQDPRELIRLDIELRRVHRRGSVSRRPRQSAKDKPGAADQKAAPPESSPASGRRTHKRRRPKIQILED